MSARPSTPIRIGTRGSALARVQANLVVAALAAEGVPCELVVVETEGDRRAPDTAWGEGAFVAAIERALLAGEVDVAVHSAKDVPTDEDARLRIAAFLPRADPRDVVAVAAANPARRLADLPAGAVIGTDSPRRSAFVRARHPDLEIRPLHGNVDTRLRRLDEGRADALVLAAAGLARLGRDDRITELLPPEVVPPAPGQGAIAVQVRTDDERTSAAVSTLDDRPTRIAVEAERAFLRASGGGCRAPIGALATVRDEQVELLGGFATADGRTALETVAVPVGEAPAAAAALASRLARRLTGGRGHRVLLTRQADQSEPLVNALERQGVEALVVPTIAVEPVEEGGAFDDALLRLAAFDWAVVTSANGARAVVVAAGRLGIELRDVRWAAVGRTTAGVLERAGVADVWVPRRSRGTAIAEELPVAPGARVLLLRGSLADDRLPRDLRRRGIEVTEAVAYRTIEGPESSRPRLDRALAAGGVDAVLFASESAVHGLLALAGTVHRDRALSIPAICIGPATTAAAATAGFTVLGAPASPSSEALASATVRLLRISEQGVHA